MRIEVLLIAILVFSGLIIGCSIVYGGLLSGYGKTATDISYISKTIEIYNQTSNVQSKISNVNVNNIWDAAVNILQGGYESLKMMFSSVNVFSAMVTQINIALKNIIPDWFTGMIVGIIGLIVVVAIIAAVLKWRV